MRLLEIQRQLKKNRRYRNGNYVVEVRLENPGAGAQEFLRVYIREGEQEVAKGLFKQWEGKNNWEPLSITTKNYQHRKRMQEMMYTAAREAGYLV
jgi:hypothetical protein